MADDCDRADRHIATGETRRIFESVVKASASLGLSTSACSMSRSKMICSR